MKKKLSAIGMLFLWVSPFLGFNAQADNNPNVQAMINDPVEVTMQPVQIKSHEASMRAPLMNFARYSLPTQFLALNGVYDQDRNDSLKRDLVMKEMSKGSGFEACQNYQMEQFGLALSSSHSKLKSFLKDYSKVYGGKVIINSFVQADYRQPGPSVLPPYPPTFGIRERGDRDNEVDDLQLTISPVVFMNSTNGTATCKTVSAAEILRIATIREDELKAAHLKKMKDREAFRVKDVVSMVSSTLQTVPKFGYPKQLAVEVDSYRQEKDQIAQATQQQSQPTADRSPAGWFSGKPQ